jgi:hypothetical protein
VQEPVSGVVLKEQRGDATGLLEQPEVKRGEEVGDPRRLREQGRQTIGGVPG